MLQKILLCIMIGAGAFMLGTGVAMPSVLHVAFGVIVMGGGVILLQLHLAETASNYDEKTNRYYKFAKNPGDNPHHGVCPICYTLQPVIYTTVGKPRRYGVYCTRHNEQWFS